MSAPKAKRMGEDDAKIMSEGDIAPRQGFDPAALRGAFTAGSLGWLIVHDLTLSWRRFRSMFGALSPRAMALVVIGVLLVFHAIALPVARWFAQTQDSGPNAKLFYPAVASLMLFVTPWLISQALTNTTRALYTRGDLDLLLASPIPARRVLAARAIAIAIEAISSVAIFLLPIANMNALIAGWRWLAIYPTLLATGLFATAIGLTLALGLFRIAGPRRTRALSQILATLIGACFVLGLQFANVLPAETRDALIAVIDESHHGGVLDRNSALWLPVRAAAGHGRDLVMWSALSLALFAATAWLLGERFATSVVSSAGAPAAGSRRRLDRRVRFRAGVGRALRAKEWKLIARDPWLISQITLQVIYTLPVAIVIWRSQGGGGGEAVGLSVAPAIVVVAAQLAASLAWLTISSEDAPEFLATAPVRRADLERRKLEAVAAPLACFIALPLAGLALLSLKAALLAAVFAVCAALSTALLNLWHPMPGRRVMVLRRHAQSKLVAMMEHLLSLLWALIMVLTVFGSLFALVPLALVCGVLWMNRPRPAASPALALAR